MTFSFDLDLAVMRFNMHTRNEDVASKHSRVIMLKDTWAYIQTSLTLLSPSLSRSVSRVNFEKQRMASAGSYL